MRVYDNGVYRDMTDEEEAMLRMNSDVSVEAQINELKEKLRETDYQAIKYAEGLISEEDYAVIKKQRQEWRDKINELESEG
ncbi:hypothetical protein [Ruminococcus sp.]|uniref:hypothetical protein n=1 Tax=Ruminococcus sp. TaxID=41978 RepID=UPI00260E2370|nr:hypothetical protein [Ruminococcus sp.]MDD6990155.1 hypothetical protein [Ruminococcus sp.]MDY6202864.1 hypothetical protein [Ruminococcus sp.]